MVLIVNTITGRTNKVLHYAIGPKGDDQTFVRVFDNGFLGIDMSKAKEYATLFAHAPEMLEMLKRIYDCTPSYTFLHANLLRLLSSIKGLDPDEICPVNAPDFNFSF